MGSVTTGRARPAEQLAVEPRCRSASLSIGYAMAIHKPMAVGGTRVVGSGMRVGRPAGGSSWPPRTHHPGAARPARRVVVGNLGYDVSFTLPKSYSLPPAVADTAAAAAVESVYTEAVGRAFGWAGRSGLAAHPVGALALQPAEGAPHRLGVDGLHGRGRGGVGVGEGRQQRVGLGQGEAHVVAEVADHHPARGTSRSWVVRPGRPRRTARRSADTHPTADYSRRSNSHRFVNGHGVADTQ